MTKNLLLFLILFGVKFSTSADSETPTTPDNRPIKLTPKPKPGKESRMPAMPIYGEYVNPVLYLHVDESEECEYELIISKDGIEVEGANLSGKDLNSGYEVIVSAPFSIQLNFENSSSYSGYVF